MWADTCCSLSVQQESKDRARVATEKEQEKEAFETEETQEDDNEPLIQSEQ